MKFQKRDDGKNPFFYKMKPHGDEEMESFQKG